jgi:hypothetical protein
VVEVDSLSGVVGRVQGLKTTNGQVALLHLRLLHHERHRVEVVGYGYGKETAQWQTASQPPYSSQCFPYCFNKLFSGKNMELKCLQVTPAMNPISKPFPAPLL